MAPPSALENFDYRGQVIENCEFFSGRHNIVTVITAKDPSGSFVAYAVKRNQSSREAILFSESSATPQKAVLSLHNKSCQAVAHYIDANGFDAPPCWKKNVKIDSDDDDDDVSVATSLSAASIAGLSDWDSSDDDGRMLPGEKHPGALRFITVRGKSNLSSPAYLPPSIPKSRKSVSTDNNKTPHPLPPARSVDGSDDGHRPSRAQLISRMRPSSAACRPPPPPPGWQGPQMLSPPPPPSSSVRVTTGPSYPYHFWNPPMNHRHSVPNFVHPSEHVYQQNPPPPPSAHTVNPFPGPLPPLPPPPGSRHRMPPLPHLRTHLSMSPMRPIGPMEQPVPIVSEETGPGNSIPARADGDDNTKQRVEGNKSGNNNNNSQSAQEMVTRLSPSPQTQAGRTHDVLLTIRRPDHGLEKFLRVIDRLQAPSMLELQNCAMRWVRLRLGDLGVPPLRRHEYSFTYWVDKTEEGGAAPKRPQHHPHNNRLPIQQEQQRILETGSPGDFGYMIIPSAGGAEQHRTADEKRRVKWTDGGGHDIRNNESGKSILYARITKASFGREPPWDMTSYPVDELPSLLAGAAAESGSFTIPSFEVEVLEVLRAVPPPEGRDGGGGSTSLASRAPKWTDLVDEDPVDRERGSSERLGKEEDVVVRHVNMNE